MGWVLVGGLIVGLSLGVMGSGGSIITVPILTYLIGHDEKVAIAGSLAIVGSIALITAIPHAVRRLVDYRSVFFFGLPGMAGSYLGTQLSRFASGGFQLAVFALLMLVAAVFMLRPPDLSARAVDVRRSLWKVALDGLLVGIVTGFVGVGGGFLIVPALVLLGGLSMHRAVGTSLFIIALNSFTGFYGYQDVLRGLQLSLDWEVIGAFSLLGIVGGLVGNAVGSRLPQRALRRSFGAFLIAVGLFIVTRSLSDLFAG